MEDTNVLAAKLAAAEMRLGKKARKGLKAVRVIKPGRPARGEEPRVHKAPARADVPSAAEQIARLNAEAAEKETVERLLSRHAEQREEILATRRGITKARKRLGEISSSVEEDVKAAEEAALTRATMGAHVDPAEFEALRRKERQGGGSDLQAYAALHQRKGRAQDMRDRGVNPDRAAERAAYLVRREARARVEAAEAEVEELSELLERMNVQEFLLLDALKKRRAVPADLMNRWDHLRRNVPLERLPSGSASGEAFRCPAERLAQEEAEEATREERLAAQRVANARADERRKLRSRLDRVEHAASVLEQAQSFVAERAAELERLGAVFEVVDLEELRAEREAEAARKAAKAKAQKRHHRRR